MTPAEREQIADLVVALVAATRVEQVAEHKWRQAMDATAAIDTAHEVKFRDAVRATEAARHALALALGDSGDGYRLFQRLVDAAHPPVSS